MDELLSYRDQFPILGQSVYLINHSLGAMPARTAERLREYFAPHDAALEALLGEPVRW